MKARELWQMVNGMDSIIVLQQAANNELDASYRREVTLLNQKFETQKSITSDFVRLAESWKREAEYYQQRDRKSRWGKVWLVFIIVIEGILIVVK